MGVSVGVGVGPPTVEDGLGVAERVWLVGWVVPGRGVRVKVGVMVGVRLAVAVGMIVIANS